MNLDYWPQVLSIIVANLGMFLWSTRQARSDYLHMDKKFEDNRREMNQTVKTFMEQTTKMLERFEQAHKGDS